MAEPRSQLWVATGSRYERYFQFYFRILPEGSGPTQFIDEVDDGTSSGYAELNAIQKAFKGSNLSWTKKGDGHVIMKFVSYDTKKVTVNIISGGEKIDEVEVAAGGIATWNSTVSMLGGKHCISIVGVQDSWDFRPQVVAPRCCGFPMQPMVAI
ncbi:unnamed protein product [Peronospora belbahrii]|uniref:Uncharacterized protein n=1 Tax=Peronospora belbahrii TaxID=622444 RepID=A0ABN8D0J0_9STRA|nr:unnamed protein product [Peronospora belbahrii]